MLLYEPYFTRERMKKGHISQTLFTRKLILHPVLIGEWYVTHLTEGKRRVKAKEREKEMLKAYLSDPVGVQYTHVGVHSTDTLLCSRSKRSLELELRNTLVLGFSVHNSL